MIDSSHDEFHGLRHPWWWSCLLLAMVSCSVLEPEFKAEPTAAVPEPVTVEVVFEGAKGISRGDLLRVIEDQMLDLSRRPEREATLFDAALDLEDRYREAGYPEAKVGYRLPDRAPGADRIDVTFTVDEGEQVVVSELEFDGCREVDEKVLRGFWRQRLSGTFGLGQPLLIQADLDAVAQATRNHYWSEGYLEVEVDGPEITRDGNRARVVFTIAEGPRYSIAATEVDPEVVAPLGDAAPALPSGPATTQTFREYELAVRVALRKHGYPDPDVTLKAHADRESKTVDLTLRGTPGRKGVIAEIEIRGNDRTQSSFITSRLGLQSDTAYDGSAEEAGIEKLYRTGLFRKITVKHEWIDDERLREVVEVEEIETGTVDLLLGYGSYERFRGGLRFGERNLFGTGKDLLLEGRLSQKGYRAGTTLTDPDLFLTGTTFSISGELFRREEPSFTDESLGGTVALSRWVLPGVRGRLGYTLASRSGSDTTVLDPTVISDYREGRVFLEMNYDTRDNPLYPRFGHQVLFGADTLSPSLGADVQLQRARAAFALHVPIVGDTRLALHSEHRWLWPNEGSARVPIQERYFLGGENTVRSFRESRLGPKDASGQPLGGEFSNLFSAELRIPIWRAFEAAAFVDAGNVGSNIQNYGLSNLSYAVGAGLRLALPIGPLRVDAAHNPDPDPGDSDWVVHFSVGYPF